MKSRREFASDEAYQRYSWSLNPEDWTDEDWAEYLQWRASLPGFDTSADVNHLVIIGRKKNIR